MDVKFFEHMAYLFRDSKDVTIFCSEADKKKAEDAFKPIASELVGSYGTFKQDEKPLDAFVFVLDGTTFSILPTNQVEDFAKKVLKE